MKRTFWVVCATMIHLLMGAQNSSFEEELIPMDPSVKVGSLDNGLTYYIKENREPQKRAQLYLVVKAGSLQETEEQLGLAHFTEHMAFNGTESFPKNDLIDYLQRAGIRFGADLNAYTSFNETVYQLPLPTDDTELFESGFQILSEWAGGIKMEPEEIDSERGVIIAEERQRGKNANERMSKQLLPVLLANSRYKDRLPIGEVEIIENFEYETLESFYRDWYRPDLQAVIAVGDFEMDRVEELIQRHFSGLPSSDGQPEKLEYTIPDNEQPLVKVVTDPEFPYTVASVIYKHPGQVTRTTSDFRNSIMKSAVSSMFASRLSELLRSGNAPFLNAGGSYGSYQGGLGGLDAFSLQVIAKTPDQLEEAIHGIMDEVHRMQEFGFTQTELDRVKKNFMTSVEKSYNERDKTASRVYVNQLVENFTKGEAVIDMDYSLNFYNNHLEGITLEEVNTMARSLVTEGNQVILVQAAEDSAELLPDEKTLLAWVNSRRELGAYDDELIDGDLIEEELALAQVKSERKLEVDATEIILSNGVKVILKPTDFKNDQILFTSFSPGGYSLASENDVHSSKMAASIVSSSGIGNFSSSQITKLLAGKSLSVSPYIGAYWEGIRGNSSPQDLETTLQLVYLFFNHPRKDTISFKRMMENVRVATAGKESNPMAVFQDSINVLMQGRSPWAVSATVEDIDSVSLDKAMDFYQDRFADASDFTFSFVGNFEVQEILPLLQKYLGSLPSTQRVEDYKDVGMKPLPGDITKTVYRGMEDKAIVVLALHDSYEYNQENNLHLKLLEYALEDKLLKRLRERESGVYSPAVGLSNVKIPESYYTFSVSFSCAPDQVDDLIAATLNEIEQLRENGPDQDELEKFVAQEKRQLETRERTNRFWLDYLQKVYQERIPLDFIDSYRTSLDSLKIEDVREASQEFLDTQNTGKLILLPEDLK